MINYRIVLAVVLVFVSNSQSLAFSAVNNADVSVAVEIGWFSVDVATHELVCVATTSLDAMPDSRLTIELDQEYVQVVVKLSWLDGEQQKCCICTLTPADYEPSKTIDNSCCMIISHDDQSGELHPKLIGKMLAKALAAKLAQHQKLVADAKNN